MASIIRFHVFNCRRPFRFIAVFFALSPLRFSRTVNGDGVGLKITKFEQFRSEQNRICFAFEADAFDAAIEEVDIDYFFGLHRQDHRERLADIQGFGAIRLVYVA